MEWKDWVILGGFAIGCLSLYHSHRREKRDRILRLVERKKAALNQLWFSEHTLETMRGQCAQMANMIRELAPRDVSEGLEEKLRTLFELMGQSLAMVKELEAAIRDLEGHGQAELVLLEELLGNATLTLQGLEKILDQTTRLSAEIEKDFFKEREGSDLEN